MVLQLFFGIEIAVGHKSVERTDGMPFQTPDLFVIRIFPLGTEHIRDFVLYVCHIEVDAISEIFIDTVVVEDTQVKSGILHISGILRRRIHPDHALNRKIKQHIVCTFFVKRQFKADHVVQECSFKTQFIVGHGRPFQV